MHLPYVLVAPKNYINPALPKYFAFFNQLCPRDEIVRERNLEDENALYLKRLMNMES